MGGGGRIRRTARPELIWAAAALAVFVVLAGIARSTAPDANPAYSTASADDAGLTDLYNLLAQQGVAVEQWRRPLDELPRGPGSLVLWRPEGMTTADWAAVGLWVRQGGTLLAAVDAGETFAGPGGRPPLGLVPPTTINLPFGGRRTAVPAALAPALAGVQQVALGGAGRFGLLPAGALAYLSGPQAEPVLIGWRYGQGQVFLSADPGWPTNHLLGEADNLRLALQLLANPKAPVWFEETHHGLGEASSPWQLLRLPLRLAALQIAFALLLYALWRAARFGQALAAEPPVAERQAIEHVLALSNLYRQAGARPAACAELYRALRAALVAYTGSPAGEEHSLLARRFAGRSGEPGAPLAALLDRLAQPGGVTDAELVTLARQVGHYQRRMSRE